MMNKPHTFSFMLWMLFSISITAQDRNVLFLGNSYTYVNNMPQIVADMATNTGNTLNFDSNTPGGHTLQGHSGNSTSISKINKGGWDVVILQEQSQLPSFPEIQVQSDVYPYALQLDSLIREKNDCASTLFYMTWGRKNGDASNCVSWPPVCTYAGMDDLLRQRYLKMADTTGGDVSPVGAVWRYLRNNNPGINLYDADDSHPSAAGSYAAACAFYVLIFEKDPTQITFDFTLNATDAANIRLAAKAVAFDSLANWKNSPSVLSANFSYQHLSGFQYQFNNLSMNATHVNWTLAGNIVTVENPVFTFPGPGSYTVILKAFNGCDSVTFEKTILVGLNGIAGDLSQIKPAIFPNPARNFVRFNGFNSKIQVTVYNSNGQVVMRKRQLSSEDFDVNNLNDGIYVIRVRDDEHEFSDKLLIRK